MKADLTTNPWRVLGVHRASTTEEIKLRYKLLMRQHHPDVGGVNTAAAEVTAAYKILSTPTVLKSYIATLSVLGTHCPTCSGRGYSFKQKGFTKRVTAPCASCGGRGLLVKGCL